MEPKAMLLADPLDLLFENRNKSYGAYTLRKYYPRRLMISMGAIVSLVVLTSAAYLYFHTVPLTTRVFFIPENFIDPYVSYPKEKPVISPARRFVPKPPASVQYTVPLIVQDQRQPEPMPAIDNLTPAVIGSVTASGETDNWEIQGKSQGTDGNPGQVSETIESKPEVLGTVEIMPEFPGGIEALKRFLSKNLRMPENDLEPGVLVHVTARFVVGADGRVRDIVITQAAENVFNSEVIRVISRMPDWKPGSQNHRHVAVYYSLPVSFVNTD